VEPLSTAVAKHLISQCAEKRVEWFVFGGGDPLLRDDLPILLAHSSKEGLKNDLQTNGLLLNQRMFDSIYQHVDRIGLSIDGEDETVHDSIRQCHGHLNTVIKALDGCEKAGIPVVIRTTVLKLNLGKLVGIGNILSNYSCIRKWSIREFSPLGRGLINKSKHFVSRKAFLDEVNEITKINSRLLNIPILPVTADEMNGCYCLITVDGQFYTHPQNGSYFSCGKYPFDSLGKVFAKLKYDVSLRENRNLKEELALSII
jgi:MoaA/NifB/PqqE/SkfB family radical SAM enzyme